MGEKRKKKKKKICWELVMLWKLAEAPLPALFVWFDSAFEILNEIIKEFSLEWNNERFFFLPHFPFIGMSNFFLILTCYYSESEKHWCSPDLKKKILSQGHVTIIVHAKNRITKELIFSERVSIYIDKYTTGGAEKVS